ncbi:Cyclic phosphodiesterase [Mycena kentingensis (nom. inval.)]|nr:Cyclic phosphodiesterase [Mycena kentingensis (nom. inval.)]
MGLSLWLVPGETDAQNIQKIMDIRPNPASSTNQASYPRFHPHITLSTLPTDPEPTAEQIEAAIPAFSRPLSVTIDHVEGNGDHYFRSVYLAIQPSADLVSLHERLHLALSIAHPRTPKFPHMSLVYITDEDAAKGERTKYFDAIASRIRATGGAVSLNCGTQEEENRVSDLTLRQVWVARCEGPVETWVVEKKIPLRVD